MVQFLDCTLRDGGYRRSWEFDSDRIDTAMGSVARLSIGHAPLGQMNNRPPVLLDA
jgi:hypothetical protein